MEKKELIKICRIIGNIKKCRDCPAFNKKECEEYLEYLKNDKRLEMEIINKKNYMEKRKKCSQ